MSNRKLTWRHLKALYQLYAFGRTEAKILDNGYISNLLMSQKKLIKYKSGNIKILEATQGYALFYEQNFKTDYTYYESFLAEQGLQNDARRRYSEDDIKTLMFIAEHREELSQKLSTIRTFSSKIFKGKGSKYLENKPGLMQAVCQILNITDFPEKDPKNLQWRFVIDCLDPKAIVLCENIAHLKNPWKARERNLELWHVGGNNIAMIDFISNEKLSLPIYYSCDWDFHGLAIYSRILDKLKSKSVNLELLVPADTEEALPVDSPDHNSEWDHSKELSGLRAGDFNDLSRLLIKKLMNDNSWIEEESLDLFDFKALNIIY